GAGLRRPPTSPPQASHPRQPPPARRGGARIELRDVHFSYAAGGPEALAGVNLTIAPGETVALVGETGAGKSTLVKLVARFYDVTAGGGPVAARGRRAEDPAALRRRPWAAA